MRRYCVRMPHNHVNGLPPQEFKGLNINVHPTVQGWVVEMTPNPLYMSEAFHPRWNATFPLPEVPIGEAFTLSQHLSLLSMVLEDIAAERRDPILLST